MLTWIAPLLVFGLVIFVHELGHFVAAKLTGVYAPRFSIGFGPALWKRRFGETEYRLAAFPLGGYVRMASRDDEASSFIEGGSEESPTETPSKEEQDPNAMKPFGPKEIPPHRWFESKPLAARLFIMLAGVTMNALLALVLTTAVVLQYGHPTYTTVADSVLTGKPAVAAGLLKGDSITAINGVPLTKWEDLTSKIGTSAGVPVALGVLRAGHPVTITVTPVAEQAANPVTGKRETVGRIGIMPRMVRQPVGIGEGISEGWSMTTEMGSLVFRSLRNIHPSELGGPIAIVQASVQVARSGIQALLLLIATISINVAIFNLLPIPILDGGQIVMTVLESAKGSPFSLRTRELVLKGGLVLIAMLFVLVMFNDIARNLAGITKLVGKVFGRGA